MIALACGAAAACQSGPSLSQDGPLRLGGDQGTLCVTPVESGEYTYGFDAVENRTQEPITVDKVVLVGAKNATAHGGYLAPIVDNTLIGVMDWPPKPEQDAFTQKVAMPTTLSAKARSNLLIHLKADVPADIESVEVTYTAGGDTKRVRNSTELQIRETCT